MLNKSLSREKKKQPPPCFLEFHRVNMRRRIKKSCIQSPLTVDMRLLQQTTEEELDSGEQRSLMCCNPQGCRHDLATER